MPGAQAATTAAASFLQPPCHSALDEGASHGAHCAPPSPIAAQQRRQTGRVRCLCRRRRRQEPGRFLLRMPVRATAAIGCSSEHKVAIDRPVRGRANAEQVGSGLCLGPQPFAVCARRRLRLWLRQQRSLSPLLLLPSC